MESANYVAVLAILNVMLHRIAKKMPKFETPSSDKLNFKDLPNRSTPEVLASAG